MLPIKYNYYKNNVSKDEDESREAEQWKTPKHHRNNNQSSASLKLLIEEFQSIFTF
jgi:hypothetical protein